MAWTGVVAAGALREHGSDRRCGGGVHTVRDGSAVEMEVSERASGKLLLRFWGTAVRAGAHSPSWTSLMLRMIPMCVLFGMERLENSVLGR